MAGDVVSVVTKKGLGSRLTSSISGVFLGIILFFASFGVLYWNEGRVGLFPLAQSSTEIKSDVVNTDINLDNQAVSTTGKITSEALLGDDLYLQPGKYAVVNRIVEMYAWTEKSETSSSSNTGGSQTDTTTYTYKKDWVENVTDSADFNTPIGHENPAKALNSQNTATSAAKIGVYDVDLTNIKLPNLNDLKLTQDNSILSFGVQLVGSNYLYISAMKESPALDINNPTVTVLPVSTYTNPQIGDLRISYQVLSLDTNVTVFGKLSGSSITAFLSKDGQKLFRLFTDSRDGALNQIKTEDTIKTWLLRGAGFLMMWIGLSSLFAPLTTLADIIPIFGSIGKALVGGITMVIAFVLTLLTIVISMMLHNPVALVIVEVLVIVIIGGVVFLLMKFKKRAA
ncbi:MAG: TMEM43 family protein [bacterium]